MRVVFLIVIFSTTAFLLIDPLSLSDAVYLSVLLVVLPGLAIAQPAVSNVTMISRQQAYVTSGITILSIGSLALALGLRGDNTGNMGEYFYLEDWSQVILASLALTCFGLTILSVFYLLRRYLGISETEITSHLIPVTRRDKMLFTVLAVCAGFGEEVAYRAYTISTIATATDSPFGATVLSSVAFGMVHSYQGILGVFRTGIFGLMMGFTLLYTESIWSVMMAHVLINLLVGLVLAEKLID